METWQESDVAKLKTNEMRAVYDWFINHHIGKCPAPSEFLAKARELRGEKKRKRKMLAGSHDSPDKNTPMPESMKTLIFSLTNAWSLPPLKNN